MARARGVHAHAVGPMVRLAAVLAVVLAWTAGVHSQVQAIAVTRRGLRTSVVRAGPGPPPPPDTPCVTEDALAAIYSGLGGSSWFNQTGWAGAAEAAASHVPAAASSPACQWFGIECDGNGAVVAVRLSGNGLAGQLTSQMLCLGPGVQGMDLSSNALSGTLPAQVSTKAMLGIAEVNLARNGMGGPIPTWLCSIHGIKYLWLDHNTHFNGTIPSCIGQLTMLRHIDLAYNRFTGEIPASALVTLTSLEHLKLSWNKLTGTLPPELWSMPSLRYLELTSNQLHGSLSPDVGQLANLTRLQLGYNLLTGSIPATLGTLQKLRHLHLYSNGLEGPLPASLAQLQSVHSMLLTTNHLSGPITSVDWSQMANLQWLSLAANEFTGTIPPSLLDCDALPSLEQVVLTSNHFSGQVPPIGACGATLQKVDLSFNSLTGTLPEFQPGCCDTLNTFSVKANLIAGTPPASLWTLPNLTTAELSLNRMSCQLHVPTGGLPQVQPQQLDMLVGNLFTCPVPPRVQALDVAGRAYVCGNARLYTSVGLSVVAVTLVLAATSAHRQCSKGILVQVATPLLHNDPAERLAEPSLYHPSDNDHPASASTRRQRRFRPRPVRSVTPRGSDASSRGGTRRMYGSPLLNGSRPRTGSSGTGSATPPAPRRYDPRRRPKSTRGLHEATFNNDDGGDNSDKKVRFMSPASLSRSQRDAERRAVAARAAREARHGRRGKSRRSRKSRRREPHGGGLPTGAHARTPDAGTSVESHDVIVRPGERGRGYSASSARSRDTLDSAASSYANGTPMDGTPGEGTPLTPSLASADAVALSVSPRTSRASGVPTGVEGDAGAGAGGGVDTSVGPAAHGVSSGTPAAGTPISPLFDTPMSVSPLSAAGRPNARGTARVLQFAESPGTAHGGDDAAAAGAAQWMSGDGARESGAGHSPAPLEAASPMSPDMPPRDAPSKRHSIELEAGAVATAGWAAAGAAVDGSANGRVVRTGSVNSGSGGGGGGDEGGDRRSQRTDSRRTDSMRTGSTSSRSGSRDWDDTLLSGEYANDAWAMRTLNPKKSALRATTIQDERQGEIAMVIRKEVYVYLRYLKLVAFGTSLLAVACVGLVPLYMKAPAIFACRGDSEVTATFLTRTPTPVIAAMQLVAFATAAATLWLLYSQRMQKWDALQRWTQAAVDVAQMLSESINSRRGARRIEARVLPGAPVCRRFCVLVFVLAAIGVMFAPNAAYVLLESNVQVDLSWKRLGTVLITAVSMAINVFLVPAVTGVVQRGFNLVHRNNRFDATLCIAHVLGVINIIVLPIVAVLLFHQRCLLHAYRPVAPTVVSVTEPVCAVFSTRGKCALTADQEFTSVVSHPFKFSPTCASAVLDTYGPVHVAIVMLQCMCWAALYIAADTPLLRRWSRHAVARMTCRSPNTVVVGGHGVPMYLAYSYAERLALFTLVLAFGPVYPFLAAAGVLSFWTSWWALTSIVGAAEKGGRTKRWHVQGARGVPLLALFIAMELACVVNGLFFQTSRLGGPLFPYFALVMPGAGLVFFVVVVFFIPVRKPPSDVKLGLLEQHNTGGHKSYGNAYGSMLHRGRHGDEGGGAAQPARATNPGRFTAAKPVPVRSVSVR